MYHGVNTDTLGQAHHALGATEVRARSPAAPVIRTFTGFFIFAADAVAFGDARLRKDSLYNDIEWRF